MKKLLIILIALFLLLTIFAVIPVSVGNRTGLSPKTHGCIGFVLNKNQVHKIFPDARIKVFVFDYYVSEEIFNDWSDGYCLGKDLWHGE